MTKNVLIVDYSEERIRSLKGLIEAHLGSKGYMVFDLLTGKPPATGQRYNVDHEKLSKINIRDYSLLIGHMAGNPSGEDCLNAFKRRNPKGRAMFYTKRDDIKLEEFNRFKLANKIFRRSDNDAVIFDDPNAMINDIESIMEEPGINVVESVWKDKTVFITVVTLITTIIGLAAALVERI